MPSQYSYKFKSPQNWREKKKKYYLGNKSQTKPWQKERQASAITGYAKTRDWTKMLTAKFFKLATYGLIVLVLIGVISVIWLSRGLPDPNRLIDRQVAQSTKIYDRTGQNILYEIHGDQKRTLVNLSDIPDYVKNATITIEDKDFYKHRGFSVWAMVRTLITNVLLGRKAGGSTLTQQFIKNAILTNEKTFTRKIKELILAYRVEKKFTKDEILQMYFNEIPYGSTAYGVEAASQRYFGKSVKDVNLAEAAVLAALPQAPSRYSPYGANKDLLIGRQHYILDQMVKSNYITKDEAEAAKNTELTFKEQTDNITAPHFVMYVKELLADKYGEKMIEQEGLKIYTTLDLYKQKIAEEVITEKTKTNQEKYQASNAALISLDPKTGQILAMVGSRDYFNNDIDGQVNVVLQPRQPGSSFKPIVYTAAFIKGYTPDTVLYDVVTNFSTDPAKPYEPHNYDSKEHGPVTMRQALAGSLNIPAVKTIYLAGIDNVLNLAENLGYSTLAERERFGLSLVLGGGEVKLLDHAAAYAVFAREGIYHAPQAILKIEDKNGKVIEEFKSEEKQVLEAKYARLTNSILTDNAARAYIFGENNYLTLGDRPVAAKTGTTNDYRDAWTLGFTPSLVTGVWVGNNNNSEMKRGADGSVVAAPIWHDYMAKVLGDTPRETFKAPEIIKTGKPVLDGEVQGKTLVKIDRASGLLATEYTPASYVVEKEYSQPHCILYYVNKDDPTGPPPADPRADPQFELWETRVIDWANRQGISSSTPPTEYDTSHNPTNRPNVIIEYPANNQSIMDEQLSVNINATAPRGISRAEYYVDNNLLAKITSYPFNLRKNISFLANGFHGLMVKVCDDIDNCTEVRQEFNLILAESKKNLNISLTWSWPTGEVTLTDKDFPFLLKVSLSNVEQIYQIKFYLKDSSDTISQLAEFSSPGSPVETNWQTKPAPGVYKIYAQATGWNGQTAKSKEIKVIVR